MESITWKKFRKEAEKRNKKILAEYKKGRKTLSQIGEEYGIGKSRVSKIMKAALEKQSVSTIDKR